MFFPTRSFLYTDQAMVSSISCITLPAASAFSGRLRCSRSSAARPSAPTDAVLTLLWLCPFQTASLFAKYWELHLLITSREVPHICRFNPICSSNVSVVRFSCTWQSFIKRSTSCLIPSSAYNSLCQTLNTSSQRTILRRSIFIELTHILHVGFITLII